MATTGTGSDALDEASWIRLTKLTEQSLANTRIADEDQQWLNSFDAALRGLLHYVTAANLLDALWATRQALHASKGHDDLVVEARKRLADSRMDNGDDGLPKLDLFDLRITLDSAPTRAQSRVDFVAGKSDGQSLFGRQSQYDPGQAGITVHDGTFAVRAASKYHERLARITELLAFAALSLALETRFLADTSCQRPALPAPDSPLPETDELAPVQETEHSVELERAETISGPVSAASTAQSRTKSRSPFWHLLTGSSSSSSSTDKGPAEARKTLRSRLKTCRTRRKEDRTKREGSDSTVVVPRGPSIELSREATWAFVGSLDRLNLVKPLSDMSGSLGSATSGTTAVNKIKRKQKDTDEKDRFQQVMRKMEDAILSVSPDVIIPPPFLLVKLRKAELDAQERADRASSDPTRSNSLHLDRSRTVEPSPAMYARRPRAYSSVESRAIVFGLASPDEQHSATDSSTSRSSSPQPPQVKLGAEARAGLASLLTHNNSLEGAMRHQGIQFLSECTYTASSSEAGAVSNVKLCAPPRWLSFHYYDSRTRPQREGTSNDQRSNEAPDLPVGLFIGDFVDHRDDPCEAKDCHRPMREHVLSWCHSAERINMSISPAQTDEDGATQNGPISGWIECKICGARTVSRPLSSAALLFSFAKYAELLIYDANLVPEPQLCEHAPTSRGALVRKFSKDAAVVTIQIEPISYALRPTGVVIVLNQRVDRLFELQMPRAVKGATEIVHIAPPVRHNRKEELKMEIEAFYRSLNERLDELQGSMASANVNRTQRLERSDSQRTVKDRIVDKAKQTKDALAAALTGDDEVERDTKTLLGQLRQYFRDDERDLLDMQAELTESTINDGRWSFLHRMKAAQRRLDCWQQLHLPDSVITCAAANLVRPFYAEEGLHALPVGSSVVYREREISSAIAVAVSTDTFRSELESAQRGRTGELRELPTRASVRLHPATSDDLPLAQQPAFAFDLFANAQPAMSRSASSSASVRSKSSRTSMASASDRDPDDWSASFCTAPSVDYSARQRKPARAIGSTLIRSVRGLGKQISLDNMPPLRSPSILTPNETPSPAEGSMDDQKKLALSDSVLEKLVSDSSLMLKPAPSTLPLSTPSVISSLSKARTASSPARASVISASMTSSTSSDSLGVSASSSTNATVELDSSAAKGETYGVASGAAALSTLKLRQESRGETTAAKSEKATRSVAVSDAEDARPSGFGLSTLLSMPSSFRRSTPSPSQGPTGEDKAAPKTIPTGHVKFKVRYGSQLLRTTAYHADKFETLRKRCGISEDSFIESLSRCDEHAPTGGKSTARFWMTRDKRYVLKELKETWPVSERDAFLHFAPHLIDYLLETENRPSLLTKIFGFYTIKTRNLATKVTVKTHLVVMENLFGSQSAAAISRQFDLKGIATRVAQQRKAGKGPGDDATHAAAAAAATGWDQDWLSGSLDTRLLIYAHSKVLLREALANDCAFLAQQECVDYSLLVGVSDAERLIHVGVIDTLGTFNALKRLESLSKTGIKLATLGDTDAVTVLPPLEYAERFKHAMSTYFIAVPEKLTRPIGEDEAMSKPRLASVL